MVDQFNKRIGYQGLTSDEMQAVCAELKGKPGELDDEKFDVVVVSTSCFLYYSTGQYLIYNAIPWQCAAAYHHFTSIDGVTWVLAHFLKPGGALLVVDLLKTDGGHGHIHQVIPDDTYYVAHKGGLDEFDMRKAFESAGLSFEFNPKALRVQHNGYDVHLFTAKGIKPPA
jgi:hypothetical protein